jgi:hypothetical protein
MSWFSKLFGLSVDMRDPILPMDMQEIKDIVNLHCLALHEDNNIDFFNEDKQYYAPSYRDLKDLVVLCPSKRYLYVAESRDCDDFVRIFRGWLSEQGMGNLTCMKVHIDNGKVLHALILAITSDKVVYFIEPQTGQIKKPYGTVLKVFA